jgi:hypothetical protein
VGTDLRDHRLYGIADMLGNTVFVDTIKRTLTGKAAWSVDLDGLIVPFELEIVSTHLTDAAYMVLARSRGNLAVLLAQDGHAAKPRKVCALVNVAKGPVLLHGFLEHNKPQSVEEAVDFLGKAVVAKFAQTDKKTWKTLS